MESVLMTIPPVFCANASPAGLASDIAHDLSELAANWPKDLPSGIVHADFFPDNVFFQDKTFVAAIDFYFACSDALAYDLAICLNAWCFEQDGTFNLTKGRAMIQAVARIGAERNCWRFEWTALNWNKTALDFYRKLGAQTMDEWVLIRLNADGLRRLGAHEF